MTSTHPQPRLLPPAEAPAGAGRPVVVYDGECGMCRSQMRRLERFDWLGRLDAMAYDDAVLVYPEVSRELLDEGIRVRFPDGSVTIGIDAVRSSMVRTPLGALVGWALYLPGVHAVGARVYRRIAARRRRDVCSLPEAGRRSAD